MQSIPQIVTLTIVFICIIGCGSENSNSNYNNLDLGIKAFDAGDYKKAITFFDSAIRKDEKNSSAWGLKGESLRHLKAYSESLQCYKKVIEIDPNNPYARLDIATILAACPEQQIREGKVALEIATKCYDLNQDPKLEPRILALFASCHAELGNYDEAVGFINKAINHPQIISQHKSEYMGRLNLFKNNIPYRE